MHINFFAKIGQMERKLQSFHSLAHLTRYSLALLSTNTHSAFYTYGWLCGVAKKKEAHSHTKPKNFIILKINLAMILFRLRVFRSLLFFYATFLRRCTLTHIYWPNVWWHCVPPIQLQKIDIVCHFFHNFFTIIKFFDIFTLDYFKYYWIKM